MHKCVTWPQWVNEAQVPSKVSNWWSVNSSPPRATYMRRWTGSALVQIMAWHQISHKPLSEPMLIYCKLDSLEQISVKFESEFYHFHSRKCIRKCRLPNWQPFCPGRDSWGSGQWQTTASTFPGTLEQWMTWDVCGLRSPSLQSSDILCITFISDASLQELVMQGLEERLKKLCLQCNRDTWHTCSKHILQAPKDRLMNVKWFSYIANQFIKDTPLVPLDSSKILG